MNECELACSLVSLSHFFFTPNDTLRLQPPIFPHSYQGKSLRALFLWEFSGGSSEADRARCTARKQVTFKARLTIKYIKDGRWRYHTTSSEDTKSGQHAVDIRQCSWLLYVARSG